jgi:flagellar biosynthesis protein FliR
MRVDVSFLPALAASFLLVFARIGTMVMLLPGLGELTVPARVRLGIALVLTAILFPLHRGAYQLDLASFTPALVMLALGPRSRRRWSCWRRSSWSARCWA